MTIYVCSQARAIELVKEAKKKTSVISITSKEERQVTFPANTNMVSVLHLKFNDLMEEYDEEGIPYGRPLPLQEDFTGLKEFVDNLQCECLIVHCWEGTSRSAAVAKATYEYRGYRDNIHLQKDVSPNPLVYVLAKRELEKTALYPT